MTAKKTNQSPTAKKLKLKRNTLKDLTPKSGKVKGGRRTGTDNTCDCGGEGRGY